MEMKKNVLWVNGSNYKKASLQNRNMTFCDPTSSFFNPIKKPAEKWWDIAEGSPKVSY